MKHGFSHGVPIWGKSYLEEKNITLFFVVPLTGEETKIRITASSFYRLVVDGKFLAYGPSRDAHARFRVDEIPLPKKAATLLIEVAGYHCCSFYALDQTPFVLFEVDDASGNIIHYSSPSTLAFRNTSRLQKVTRFSYQRAFSESYVLSPSHMDFLHTGIGDYPKVELTSLPFPVLDRRIVPYPKYPSTDFTPIEEGHAEIDPSKKDYEDRYQWTEYLKIFPRSEWEIDSNHVASCLAYSLSPIGECLENGEFRTYSLPSSLTGFFYAEVEAKEDALLYILFDEVALNENEGEPLSISFCRNTTHNCLTYSLKKGHYRLMSFEPYTARYARIVVLSGKAKILRFRLVRYENPDVDAFRYSFADKRFERIFDAAKSTFAQNAVDLLTDCPSRERAGWLCDSYFSGQVEPLLTGNAFQEKAFLDNYIHAKRDDLPKGMIPMCYPADFPSKEFIPNWSLWYILELYEYRKRNGNDEVVQGSLENIRGILSYFQSKENESGMLEDLEGWVFVEWSKANDPEFIAGVNAPSNMLYAEALQKAGILLQEESLITKGDRLKKAIRSFFFRGDFFVDNALRNQQGELVLTDHTSETCQYYALYFGIITPEEDPSFFAKMRDYFGEHRNEKKTYPRVYKSNLLMGILLRLEVLLRAKEPKRVLEETIGYFDKMASLTGTLWEHDDVYASLNHCFASFVIALQCHANFGLRYIDEEKKEIHLSSIAALEEGSISIPLRNGRLFIRAKNGIRTIRKTLEYRLVCDD